MIDVVPTILDLSACRSPTRSNGIAQRPMDGVSMAYTLPAEKADAPSHAQDAVFRDPGQPRHLS